MTVVLAFDQSPPPRHPKDMTKIELLFEVMDLREQLLEMETIRTELARFKDSSREEIAQWRLMCAHLQYELSCGKSPKPLPKIEGLS